MKYFHPLCFFLISIVFLTGCNDKSLQPEYSGIKMNNNALNDTLRKLDSLANVNKIFNNALARFYAKKALILAQKSNSESAFVQAYFIMGFTYRNYNDDSSFLYTSRSLRIAEKINMEKYRTRAMYNLALLYCGASDVSTLSFTLILQFKFPNGSGIM